jgi:hypothetical protein
MAVSTKKYTKKHSKTGRIYRAVRVTLRNYINVANWSGGIAIEHVDASGDISKQRVKVKGLVAQPGDFVVKDEDGKFFRVKDDVFEAEFQLAPKV